MNESMLQLLISMTNNRPLHFVGSDSIERTGVVNSIEAEDGTRTGFNIGIIETEMVKSQPKSKFSTIYVKRPIGSGLTKSDPIRTMR